MTTQQPDPLAQFIAHAAVGMGAAALTGQRVGTPFSVLAFTVAVVVHHLLDAPLAKALSNAGI